mgnify:FL=1
MAIGPSPQALVGSLPPSTLPSMWQHLSKYRIILGSQSPRRVELLRGLDLPFEQVLLEGVDESYPATLRPEEIPLYIAQHKAESYRPLLDDQTLLITADTLVFIEDQVLGKPKSEEEARAMLRQLSGRSHSVTTGVTLTTTERMECFSDTATVEFLPLADEEIDYYVRHYHPLDKAGAYGIQEWIGYIGVTSINGSYFNVMGLPVQRLWEEIKKI